ncbi:LEF-6 [Lymantria xylina nucleopolyhedrovirus]|uniref:LEF-6 n=1 Tax=Lymantria xylina multiple nucleopolyhedrovirus TaxID=2847840 RepID=D4N271_9ABAC|nr:LEF-6 [Lymantria xylina nucleopolyhedrovirus]ADD73743.1 LEF-6 [Lymantria xylina nucleopolyhedrovirus]
MGKYNVRINGGRYEKRFTKKFLTSVCGKRIDDQVQWDQCTRKLLSVASDDAVRRLLRLDRRAFWPDGAAFRCSIDRARPHRRPHRPPHRRPHRRRARRSEISRSEARDRSPSRRRRRLSVIPDEKMLQQFIDVEICEDDEYVDDFENHRLDVESIKESFNKMNI